MTRFLAWALLVGFAGAAAAQEPAGPPPPTSSRVNSGSGAVELLPDLGQIGAEVAIFGGGSRNPYQVGQGVLGGGLVDLPLRRLGAGRLSYEIRIGLSHGLSDPFAITDPIAYIANLATGASPDAALAGPPGAPFPVHRQVRSRVRILDVAPFALKYRFRSTPDSRVRPYLATGLDFVVVISREDPVADESLQFHGTSPFDASLIGGLVGIAPELAARGLPSGQGNIEFGFNAAAGVELRLARRMSLNGEYRFLAYDGTKARLHAATAALGFHW